MNKRVDVFIFAISIVAVVVCVYVAFLLQLFHIRTNPTPIQETTSIGNTAIDYKFFYIDNMPCVFVTLGDNINVSGISCDWSQFDGELPEKP